MLVNVCIYNTWQSNSIYYTYTLWQVKFVCGKYLIHTYLLQSPCSMATINTCRSPGMLFNTCKQCNCIQPQHNSNIPSQPPKSICYIFSALLVCKNSLYCAYYKYHIKITLNTEWYINGTVDSLACFSNGHYILSEQNCSHLLLISLFLCWNTCTTDKETQ